MIFRSLLMVVAGIFLLPANLALILAFPDFGQHHPVLELVFSVALMSIGPALLVTGLANLVVGIYRASRANH
jgi:hypothetical protein